MTQGERGAEATVALPRLRGAACIRWCLERAEALDRLHRRTGAHGSLHPGCGAHDAETMRWEWRAPSGDEVDLAFVAPERFQEPSPPADERSDLYALGCMFYAVAVGGPLFDVIGLWAWAHAHRTRAAPEVASSVAGERFTRVVAALVAKDPQARFQSARGVCADLVRCLRAPDDVTDLKAEDVAPVLRPAGRLWGREEALSRLHTALAGVSAAVEPVWVVVEGEAGTGKTALLQAFRETHAAEALWAAGRGGTSAAGEPWRLVREVLDDLGRGLMLWGEAERRRLRTRVGRAVDEEGLRSIAALSPSLAEELGATTPAGGLPVERLVAAELQRAITMIVQILSQFISIVIILDNPDVADIDGFKFMHRTLSEVTGTGALVVCAVRSSSRGPSGDGALRFVDLRAQARSVITLEGLGVGVITEVLHDLFRGDAVRERALAHVILERTQGNPLFVMQLIRDAVERAWIVFQRSEWAWTWDLPAIAAGAASPRVAELLLSRMSRLAPPERALATVLACCDAGMTREQLGAVLARSVEEVAESLAQLLEAQVALWDRGGYRLAHERLKEAALNGLGAAEVAALHAAIGRGMLRGGGQASAHRATLFQVASHFERALALISGPTERVEVARLFNDAARAARAEAAFEVAVRYATAGLKLLGGEPQGEEPEVGEPAEGEEPINEKTEGLGFELALTRAGALWPRGEAGAAEAALAMAWRRAGARWQQVEVLRERVELAVADGDVLRAAQAMLQGLALYGIHVPFHPTSEALLARHQAIVRALGAPGLTGIEALPLVADRDVGALLSLFRSVLAVAFGVSRELRDFLVTEVVSLTLRHGLSEAGVLALSFYGAFVAERLGRFEEAGAYAELARRLAEQPELRAVRGRVAAANVIADGWLTEAPVLIARAREGIRWTEARGDTIYTGLNVLGFVFAAAVQGTPLPELAEELERFGQLPWVQRFPFVRDTLGAARWWAAALGAEASEGTWAPERALRDAIAASGLALSRYNAACFLIQIRYFCDDLVGAQVIAEEVSALLEQHSIASPILLWTRFFMGLVAWARIQQGELSAQVDLDVALAAFRAVGPVLAPHLRTKALILEGLSAAGRAEPVEGLRQLEAALAAAQAARMHNDEAIAAELAAGVARGMGFAGAATGYLAQAERAYARWGAWGRWRRLGGGARPQGGAGGAREGGRALAIGEHQKTLEVVLQDTNSDYFVNRVLQVVVEALGMRWGVLMLADGGRLVTAASSSVGEASVGEHGVVPEGVIRHVMRTRCAWTRGGAAGGEAARREWLEWHGSMEQAGTAVCVPVEHDGVAIGGVYAVNELGVEGPSEGQMRQARVWVAQLAPTLAHARLAHALAVREQQLDAVLAAAPVGIVASDRTGVVTLVRGELAQASGGRVGATWDEVAWLDRAAAEARQGVETAAVGRLGARQVEVRAVPLRGAQGALEGQVSVLVDVTETRQLTEELRMLAARVVAVGVRERRRLARDLHDSVAQSVAVAARNVERAAKRLHDAALEGASGALKEVQAQLRTVMFDLYPAALDDLGLGPALAQLGRELAKTATTMIDVVEVGSPSTLASEVAAFLYRAARELMRNALKHAQAEAVDVIVRWRPRTVRLMVADDGIGFDCEQRLVPNESGGFGLFDLREHITYWGGQLTVRSTPDEGTSVTLELPIGEAGSEPPRAHRGRP